MFLSNNHCDLFSKVSLLDSHLPGQSFNTRKPRWISVPLVPLLRFWLSLDKMWDSTTYWAGCMSFDQNNAPTGTGDPSIEHNIEHERILRRRWRGKSVGAVPIYSKSLLSELLFSSVSKYTFHLSESTSCVKICVTNTASVNAPSQATLMRSRALQQHWFVQKD